MKHRGKLGWILLLGALSALGFLVDWAKEIVSKKIKAAPPEGKDDR